MRHNSNFYSSYDVDLKIVLGIIGSLKLVIYIKIEISESRSNFVSNSSINF